MKQTVSPADVFRHPLHLLAFGFGSGLSPVAPGTVGTLAAVPFYLLLAQLDLPLYLLTLVVTFAVGIPICGITCRHLGRHDHGGVVWDEFVGFWVTMIAAPTGWPWIVAGFLLFRFFDIWKPLPIGYFDRRMSGGLGVMIDDVLAGAYAWLCLQLLGWLLGSL